METEVILSLFLFLKRCSLLAALPDVSVYLLILLICTSIQFRMAKDYFKSVEGGLLLDVSCGSGLFSRKFSKYGAYSAVIALDFSENMLRQCYEFIKKDGTLLNK